VSLDLPLLAAFDRAECYALFLAVDDRVRQLKEPPPELLELRERLLPFYRKINEEPDNAGL